MPLDMAKAYLRQFATLEEIDHVDLSGGEPLIHLEDVKALAREARRLGLSMRVTSNGFWARSPAKARQILCELKDAGIGAVGLSIDEWHLPFVPKTVVANYVDACRGVGLQPLLSAVVRGTPSRAARGEPPGSLTDLLVVYGIDPAQLIDSSDWEARRRALPADGRGRFDRESIDRWVLFTWQILTAEGRGRDLDPVQQPFGEGPLEPCPAAGDLPTIDPSGRLFPCCSPWTSRKDHAFGTVAERSLPHNLQRMRRSALVRLIHDSGPERLILALRAAGVQFEATHSGICNQCGQLFDRLSLAELEAAAEYLLDLDRNALSYRILQIQPRVSLHDVLINARPDAAGVRTSTSGSELACSEIKHIAEASYGDTRENKPEQISTPRPPLGPRTASA
jgi:hypothetical protein